jgi:hypothetical protein
MVRLNEYIIFEIIGFLDLKNILVIRRVNKKFYNICKYYHNGIIKQLNQNPNYKDYINEKINQLKYFNQMDNIIYWIGDINYENNLLLRYFYERNNFSFILQLLKKKADINILNIKYLFQTACWNKYTELIQFLIKTKKINLETINNGYLVAVFNNDLELVKYFFSLNLNIDVNKFNILKITFMLKYYDIILCILQNTKEPIHIDGEYLYYIKEILYDKKAKKLIKYLIQHSSRKLKIFIKRKIISNQSSLKYARIDKNNLIIDYDSDSDSESKSKSIFDYNSKSFFNTNYDSKTIEDFELDDDFNHLISFFEECMKMKYERNSQ